MDPLTIAKLWMVIKPVKLFKNRRRAKQGLPPLTDHDVSVPEVVQAVREDGSLVTRTEPLIPARSSSKMFGVGATFLATTAAAVIPNYDAINTAMLAACQSEHGPLIGLGMMAAMLGVNFYTVRKTKSPIEPGKI
jgi:hypothetical protein